MRMGRRYISRDTIIGAIDTYRVIEAYPDDKYLPSYLMLGLSAGNAFHVVFGIDMEDDNVRVVTAYWPDSARWEDDMATRKPQS